MKRTISILLLLIVLFLVFQWTTDFFKKGHEVTYTVSVSDKKFEITEIYQKENGDYYDITIKSDNEVFYYTFDNEYNKQKNIIEKIEYFTNNNNSCIYPVLLNSQGSYIECNKDNQIYTDISYPDNNFINTIKGDLVNKGYVISNNSDLTKVETLNKSTIYINNLLDTDTITLWNYKGIDIINKDNLVVKSVLGFDKYENSNAYLVENYYIVPNYLSSRVLEFSSINIIDINENKVEELELGYTLSSGTYVNGVVDGKLYYTDPNNLLQIEINPSKKNVRLIGSKELGGQFYDGNWHDANIYDFVSNKILFSDKLPEEITNMTYQQLSEGNASYYIYSNGTVYQIPKKHLDKKIVLFNANNLNNLKAIEDTVYYVVNDTLYYFDNELGIIPVLKNNELRYNTVNRIDINRKS